MLVSDSDFLGQGWAYPVRVETGKVVLSAKAANIKESIHIILETSVGERLMRPTFGSRLTELVFAPINGATNALAVNFVRDALEAWEPRIDLDEVTVTSGGEDGNVLYLQIKYTIRASNVPDNLVYPFYLQP